MVDADAREELRQLIRSLRVHLEWQRRAGAHGAPGTLTERASLPGDLAPAQVPQHAESQAERRFEHRSEVATHAPAAPAPVLPDREITVADLLAALGDDDDPRAAARARAAAASSPPAAVPRSWESPAQSPPPPSPAQSPQASRLTLADVRAELGDCQRCKLASGRSKIVFGVGDPDAPLMFIGEAPGAQEDMQGEPFVGAAGQLLDRMIEAMGWTRDSVYIANVLKCRPPQNRDPQEDEIAACRPFLAKQIEAVQPRIIVTLGRPAAQLILNTQAPMNALRGRFQEYKGIKVMPTFHPAFLLRQPERKRDTWSDLKQVITELERIGIQSPNPPKT